MAHTVPSKAGRPVLESLAGMVERVTFQSDETGFSVLKVKVKGFRDLVAVVGIMPSVTAGEWIEAGGRWENDREHGQQFKVETVHTTRPDTLEGFVAAELSQIYRPSTLRDSGLSVTLLQNFQVAT